MLQSQMSCDTSGTLRDFFLDTTVRNISINSFLIERGISCAGSKEFSCNGSTYSEYMALSQRTGSIFDATHYVYFGMSRSR